MKNLLLIIDLQQGWEHKIATKAAMLRTVELAKRFDGDCIHCCFRNDPASLFYSQLNWKRFMEPSDTAVIPEFVPLKVPQYWRSTYSCLTDEVQAIVQKYDHVYIAGVFTDISVTATATGLFDQGIVTTVIGDAVATLHGEPVHLAALNSLEHAIGRNHVILSADVPLR